MSGQRKYLPRLVVCGLPSHYPDYIIAEHLAPHRYNSFKRCPVKYGPFSSQSDEEGVTILFDNAHDTRVMRALLRDQPWDGYIIRVFQVTAKII